MDSGTDVYDPEEMAAICAFLKIWKDEAPVKLAEEQRLGRQEGQQKTAQGALRTAFEARFGSPPPSLLPFFARPHLRRSRGHRFTFGSSQKDHPKVGWVGERA